MRPAVACMVCVFSATLAADAGAQQMVVSADRASGVYGVGDTVRWAVARKGEGSAPAARYVLKSGGLTEVDKGELTFIDNVATIESNSTRRTRCCGR